MANEKTLNTRILLKTGTLTEWQEGKYNSSEYLKKGEVAIVTIGPDVETTHPTDATKTHPILFKVGTGEHYFDALPWASALAADVYDWAKKPTLDANDLPEIPGAKFGLSVKVEGAGNAITTANWDAATKTITLTKGETFATKKELEDVIAAAISVKAGVLIDVEQNGTEYTVKHETVANPTETAGSGRKYLTGVTTDGYGHITGFTTASEVDQDLPTEADFGVLSVNGDKAIKVNNTDEQNPIVSLALNNSGNVVLSQSDDGLKGEIDLSEYRKIADDENTITTVSAGNHMGEIKDNGTDGNHAYVINGKDWSGEIATALADAKKYADDNDDNDNTEYHVEYDSVNKKIKLVAGADASKMEIPTDDFIKDGMIQSVAISEDGKNLVITWNTDAGKDATNIPLSELVDVMTGVDGTTITVSVSADDKISAEIKTGVIKDGHIASDAAIAKGKLASDVQASLGKADTALQAADIVNKADKVTGATNGNFAGLDANGNLTDSGKNANSFDAKGTAANLIAGLNVTNIEGFGAGKTLLTLTETDGKIAATFQEIAITESQITDLKKYALESELPTDADYGVLSVTAKADGGLAVDNTDAQNPKIAIDDSITWIFNCGGAND